jgi:hypothetical protein
VKNFLPRPKVGWIGVDISDSPGSRKRVPSADFVVIYDGVHLPFGTTPCH